MPNGMIERTHPKLSVGAQCQLLSISRSSFYYASFYYASFYYAPHGETAMNLDLMLLVRCPASDACIAERGQAIPGDPVLRCATDDLAPAERGPCREPETHPAADAPYAPSSGKQSPGLFSDPPPCRSIKNPIPASPRKGTRPTPICWAGCGSTSQIKSGARTSLASGKWSPGPFPDPPHCPMRKGFLYLVAIMDWFTRKVLAWRISNTLEAEFCLEALNETIHKFGKPGHRHAQASDAGSPFTTICGPTPPMADNRPPWSVSTVLKPISRCRP